MKRLVLCVLLSAAVALRFAFRPVEGVAGNCTDGFMPRDRMDKVLDNYIVGASYNQQAIIPEMNFTCDGHIRELIFGAQWRISDGAFPDIQIWRPTNDNLVYNRVDSVTIDVTQSDTLLYKFSLEESSMLQFQDGDVIGFYQPDGNSRLQLQLAVRRPTPLQTIYYNNGNPQDTFQMNDENTYSRNLILAVVTDSTNCTHGFMSNDTIYSLLGLQDIGRLVGRVERQQITPDIKFTCNGVITKWIIGALWSPFDSLVPELQVWRDIGNDTYRKIDGTLIDVQEQNNSLIYEYSNFTPIPFETGDVFGAFVPLGDDSRIRLRAENKNGPRNYYIITNTAQHEIIITSDEFSRGIYHPLVTVEIFRDTTLSSIAVSLSTATQSIDSTSAPSSAMIAVPTQSSTIGNVFYTSVSDSATAIDSTSAPSSTMIAVPTQDSSNSLYISVSVIGSVMAILATSSIIVIAVTICLRRRVNRKLTITTVTDNVVYGMNLDVELSDNIAYTTATNKARNYEHSYEYIISSGNNDTIIATQNEAYGIITRVNEH